MQGSWTVRQLKEKIVKIIQEPSSADDLRLLHDDNVMEDSQSMDDLGFKADQHLPHTPAKINMVYRTEGGEFEDFRLNDLSVPDPLPDVMSQTPLQGST